jgi:hypothetical protein
MNHATPVLLGFALLLFIGLMRLSMNNPRY